MPPPSCSSSCCTMGFCWLISLISTAASSWTWQAAAFVHHQMYAMCQHAACTPFSNDAPRTGTMHGAPLLQRGLGDQQALLLPAGHAARPSIVQALNLNWRMSVTSASSHMMQSGSLRVPSNGRRASCRHQSAHASHGSSPTLQGCTIISSSTSSARPACCLARWMASGKPPSLSTSLCSSAASPVQMRPFASCRTCATGKPLPFTTCDKFAISGQVRHMGADNVSSTLCCLP